MGTNRCRWNGESGGMVELRTNTVIIDPGKIKRNKIRKRQIQTQIEHEMKENMLTKEVIKVLSHEERMAQEKQKFVSPANLVPAPGGIFSPGPAEELLTPEQKEALRIAKENSKLPKIKLKSNIERERLPPVTNNTTSSKLRDRLKLKKAPRNSEEHVVGTLQNRLKNKQSSPSRLKNRLRKKEK